MIQRCMDRYKDEQTLETQGRANELLAQSFAALEAWNRDVDLSISPGTPRHAGATSLYSLCYVSDELPSFLTPTLQPCLEAVRLSKMRFCKLDVFLKNAFSPSLGDFDLESYSKEDMQHFSRLKSITFALERLDGFTSVLAMTAIISQAYKLEVLYLSHCDSFSPSHRRGRAEKALLEFELGDNALESIKSDRIKTLSFATMSFSKQCILDLLHKYRYSLKSLRFAECALRDGTWIEVISFVKESLLALRMLNISHLRDATRPEPSLSPFHYRIAIVGCREKKIKGENQVQEALLRMLKRPYENPLASVSKSGEDEEEEEDDDDDDNYDDDYGI
jgi:hypothetical protein